MNSHLTEDQLYAHLADSTTQSVDHLATCSRCQAELANLSTAFGHLRGALTGLAAATSPPPFVRPVVAAAAPSRLPGLAARAILAVAAPALVLAALWLPGLHPHPQAPATTAKVASSSESTLTDDELLRSIDRDLSTSVAPPLQPLSVTTGTSYRTTSTQAH